MFIKIFSYICNMRRKQKKKKRTELMESSKIKGLIYLIEKPRERETEKFKKVNKIDQIVQYSINTHLHFDCH